ncbi:ribosome-releasing factor 2, mitochondrial [Coccinella septempunctata]|uniref:ribosome-releasing factor 2, mitochondrial n=1 Tax=Coccinella septempunctata TaxID=41139 RepID=UPI001D08740F|nr:ribosome-releasing factor 2, mitochondrial [Coccinella septempunctata]
MKLFRTFFQSDLRYFSTKKLLLDVDVNKIRNIGILAHIDAGKTTTTERMLFYSGTINQMGEVHHGNTVTDYMTQERERGITITSAAVTFFWRSHQFNLIDTPGHIDFTMEVEQSLNVLDGAVFILDASAGVEAQTLTVWRQADRYNLPRFIFLNKMDRTDASVEHCFHSIQQKLSVTPLCLQIPIKKGGKLSGLIDILTMEKLTFSNMKLAKIALTEREDCELWSETMLLRSNLVDKISEYNETLAEKIIKEESMDNIKTMDIVGAIREETLNQNIIPVVMGSAYKNIGIQALMDAVVLYLPGPGKRSEYYNCFEDNLCAKAFKITHNKQKGTLVFVKVHNGEINKGQKIYSTTQNKNELVGRLYTAFADDFHEVEKIKSGNIGVISGLKHTKMGDFLSNSASAVQKAKEKFLKTKKSVLDDAVEDLFENKVRIPEPVFFCAIEPESAAYQTALDNALMEMQRQDPSLRVTQNCETGQTVLGGMGELHLDIIKDRILKEYKVKAKLGELQINYHETLKEKTTDTLEFCTTIGGLVQKFTIRLSIFPTGEEEKKEILVFDRTQDAAKNISAIYHKHLSAIRNGVEAALANGPRISCKVSNVQVMLHFFAVEKGTSESVITAGTTQLIQKMLQQQGTDILEPVMNIEIVIPSDYLSPLLADLSRRRSTVEEISMRENVKVVRANTPLSELQGYATIIRTLSSGTATFSMEFYKYRKMSPIDEEIAIRSVRGF